MADGAGWPEVVLTSGLVVLTSSRVGPQVVLTPEVVLAGPLTSSVWAPGSVGRFFDKNVPLLKQFKDDGYRAAVFLTEPVQRHFYTQPRPLLQTAQTTFTRLTEPVQRVITNMS